MAPGIWPCTDPVGGGAYFMHPINPRRFLTASQLMRLRKLYPRAIGARVLIAGCIVILFKTMEDGEHTWAEARPPRLGGLTTCTAVADFADGGNCTSQAPVGLKLRVHDGKEVLSVLCVGKPTDESARALCFQNFHFHMWESWVQRASGNLIHGGYLLPKEIREADIINDDGCPLDVKWHSSEW